jgi:hypothetical protein
MQMTTGEAKPALGGGVRTTREPQHRRGGFLLPPTEATTMATGAITRARGKVAPIPSMDRATQGETTRTLISSPDVVVGSVAAMTETGPIVTASVTAFQIPAYAAGARHVILVVGAQKVVPDLDRAMERMESYVLPLEDARTFAAYGAHGAMNRVLFNGEPFDRVTVLLVREAIGY